MSGSRRGGEASIPTLAPIEQRCTWMAAGLIAYRLCDREYDCDACPLDAAMKGEVRIAARAQGAPGGRTSRWEFPRDRRYHSSHGWVQGMGDGMVRYGVDAFAAHFLAHATSVVLPPVHTQVATGRVGCWVMDGAELVPLIIPVSGTVARSNHAVQSDPGLLGASPYDAGWLLQIHCEDPLEDMEGLGSFREQYRRSVSDLKRLGQRVARNVRRKSAVGPTLADGGRPIRELRQILGPSRYYRMVLQFLR